MTVISFEDSVDVIETFLSHERFVVDIKSYGFAYDWPVIAATL